MEEKSQGQLLREALLCPNKNGWDVIDSSLEKPIAQYAEDYKEFLNRGKTERCCVNTAVELAEEAGFVPFVRGMSLEPGTKVYRVNRGKSIVLAVLGSAPLDQGVSITAAHLDSPRLDLKPYPLYEDNELAYLKPHYYGGIRKYQWVAIPLELRGVVAKTDGTVVQVSIGADEDDPKFTITDLLPHLAVEQSQKKLGEAIPAESLNILVGSRPLAGDTGDNRVKLASEREVRHHRAGLHLRRAGGRAGL